MTEYVFRERSRNFGLEIYKKHGGNKLKKKNELIKDADIMKIVVKRLKDACDIGMNEQRGVNTYAEGWLDNMYIKRTYANILGQIPFEDFKSLLAEVHFDHLYAEASFRDGTHKTGLLHPDVQGVLEKGWAGWDPTLDPHVRAQLMRRLEQALCDTQFYSGDINEQRPVGRNKVKRMTS